MMKEAFHYAVAHITIPQGNTLWLYGDASYATGEVYTPYADQAVRLKQKGGAPISDISSMAAGYDVVMVNCPKQKDEAEGLVALALEHSKGFVLAVAANDAGGKRLEGIFQSFGVATHSLSKHHCRMVWTHEAHKASIERKAEALAQLAPRQMEMDGVKRWTVPGLFGWNQIDEGSRLLVQHLPANLAGAAADFGCGFGYLSAKLLAVAPAITSVDAYDVDARACAAAHRNNPHKLTPYWQDMRQYMPKPVYDVVVMNPPFHTGKGEDVALGEMFVRKAWESLRAGGQLFMVANRTLPYERVVPQLAVVQEMKGYKILVGRR